MYVWKGVGSMLHRGKLYRRDEIIPADEIPEQRIRQWLRSGSIEKINNEFKPEIVEEIKNDTIWDITVQGDISLDYPENPTNEEILQSGLDDFMAGQVDPEIIIPEDNQEQENVSEEKKRGRRPKKNA